MGWSAQQEQIKGLAEQVDKLEQRTSRLTDELETLRAALRLMLHEGSLPTGFVEALAKYNAEHSQVRLQNIKLFLFHHALATGDTLRG